MLVKLNHFPKDPCKNKNIWNHQVVGNGVLVFLLQILSGKPLRGWAEKGENLGWARSFFPWKAFGQHKPQTQTLRGFGTTPQKTFTITWIRGKNAFKVFIGPTVSQRCARSTEKHRCSTNLASHFSKSEFQIGQLSSLLPSYSSNCPLHLSKVMLGYVKITRCTQIIYPGKLTWQWKLIHFDSTSPERWWFSMASIAFCGAIESIEDITKMENPEKNNLCGWVVSPGFAPNTPFYSPPKNMSHVPWNMDACKTIIFPVLKWWIFSGGEFRSCSCNGNLLIFQFPKYLEATSELPIYQVTIPLVNQIYREIEDEGIIWVIWPV